MPKKSESPRPVALVIWDDAYYDDEVHTEATLKENGNNICRLYSVGFLVHETEDQVVIAMDFGEDTSCRHVCRIRRENIRKLIMLNAGK